MKTKTVLLDQLWEPSAPVPDFELMKRERDAAEAAWEAAYHAEASRG